MQTLFGKKLAAVATLAAMAFCVNVQGHASRPGAGAVGTWTPGPGMMAASTTVAGATGGESGASALGLGQRYMLHLHHLHTGESLDIVYRVGDRYLPDAIAKLNYFLRDHRTNDVSSYDPKEFDVLHSVMGKLGRPNGVIDVVCGYRTPWSNNFLRTRSSMTGVAKNSQHVQAKAIDIRVVGVRTRTLRDVALSLAAGGVGYYPISQFVHVDVGPVRRWTFSGAGD